MLNYLSHYTNKNVKFNSLQFEYKRSALVYACLYTLPTIWRPAWAGVAQGEGLCWRISYFLAGYVSSTSLHVVRTTNLLLPFGGTVLSHSTLSQHSPLSGQARTSRRWIQLTFKSTRLCFVPCNSSSFEVGSLMESLCLSQLLKTNRACAHEYIDYQNWVNSLFKCYYFYNGKKMGKGMADNWKVCRVLVSTPHTPRERITETANKSLFVSFLGCVCEGNTKWFVQREKANLTMLSSPYMHPPFKVVWFVVFFKDLSLAGGKTWWK